MRCGVLFALSLTVTLGCARAENANGFQKSDVVDIGATVANDAGTTTDAGASPEFNDPCQKTNGKEGKEGCFDAATGPCSAAAQLVYVIDFEGVLHSFDPSTLTFKTIGHINCAYLNFVNSMAIDRNATAWIADGQGKLFKVSTVDGSCQMTTFKHPVAKFQMGFSTDVDGGTTETLFINSPERNNMDGTQTPGGLSTLDLQTLTLHEISEFGAPFTYRECELTGTGDARLLGFFVGQPASVAQIDKTTAQIVSQVSIPGVNVNDTTSDFAFSFWGGDYYLYTADAAGTATSNVTRYRPSDGSTTVLLTDIGFKITGAGVSTCAPTQSPR
jgi:hypothetical protein